MISIEDGLPEGGQKTKCVVNFWRYGQISHTEKLEATYIGMNTITGKPMWDIDTFDQAYAEVTHWGSV